MAFFSNFSDKILNSPVIFLSFYFIYLVDIPEQGKSISHRDRGGALFEIAQIG